MNEDLNTKNTKSMKHKPYPQYKPSGVEWLGEVPEHWIQKRFKYAVWLSRGVDLPIEELIDGNYPVFGSNGIIGFHNQFTTRGPCVVVGRSGSVGEVNYVEEDFWAHNTALFIQHFKGSIPRFSYYLLLVIDLKSLSAGSAVGTLNRNYIHDVAISLPPLPEQQAIAAFLDRETGRIDSLIAKKQRLLKLLAEQRTALISRAVTKGLDATVRLKPSGVEWLGDIPEHWEIWKLAHLTTRIGSGKTPTGGADVYQSEGVLFLRSQNVYDDGLYLDDVVHIDEKIDEEMAWSRVKEKDILLNITGASLGRTCITPLGLARANVNQHVCVIRIKRKEFSEYVALYLKSKPAKSFYDYVQTGSAREGLNFEQIGAFPVPLPQGCSLLIGVIYADTFII
ncbi:restriction endonuclease subunit S [Deltaproteobacteria bacterium TL4]